MKNSLIAVLMLLLLVTSCSRGKIFEKRNEIKGNVWNRFNVMEYEFNVEDTSVPYDFLLTMRYMEQVPLEYIDIEFTFYAPSGEMRTSELRVVLKDKEGKPQGKGMGDLWDLEKTLREGYKFSEAGTCKVEISSTMQYIEIPGIMQIGLIVRKSS